MRIFTETLDTLVKRLKSGDEREHDEAMAVMRHMANIADLAGAVRLPIEAEINAMADDMKGEREMNRFTLAQSRNAVFSDGLIVSYDEDKQETFIWRTNG